MVPLPWRHACRTHFTRHITLRHICPIASLSEMCTGWLRLAWFRLAWLTCPNNGLIFASYYIVKYVLFFQYLDFDNLPETNFTCAGKVIGGYYADLETSCQMFHVCTIGQLDEPMDIKFLCLNGTVFDQETRVCERVDEVDCTKSEKFYYLNLELYGNTMLPLPEGKKIKFINIFIAFLHAFCSISNFYASKFRWIEQFWQSLSTQKPLGVFLDA